MRTAGVEPATFGFPKYNIAVGTKYAIPFFMPDALPTELHPLIFIIACLLCFYSTTGLFSDHNKQTQL